MRVPEQLPTEKYYVPCSVNDCGYYRPMVNLTYQGKIIPVGDIMSNKARARPTLDIKFTIAPSVISWSKLFVTEERR